MKKLLSILFLFSSPAFAIDKPIPCDGASCKLKFETRDGSNVKVSAGEVSGATMTIGNNTVSTSGAESLTLRVGSSSSRAAARGYQNNVTKWLIGSSTAAGDIVTGDAAGDLGVVGYGGAINFSTDSGTTKHGSVSSAGAWSLGVGGQTQTIVGSFLKLNTASLPIGTIGGIYFVYSATSETCDTKCAGSEPSGLNSVSGACLKAWNSGGNPQACTVSSTNQYCLCVGIP
jgi:hypothetical protein